MVTGETLCLITLNLYRKRIDSMKQFTLEEYKKNQNRKVITRDGRSVRIVCTDMIGTYRVVAICKEDEQ